MGISAFRKIQIGKESVKGTAVPATAKLMGLLSAPDEDLHLVFTEEQRGSLAMSRRVVQQGIDTAWSFSGDLTYEQFMYFLMMGVKGNARNGADAQNPTEAKRQAGNVYTDVGNIIDGDPATDATLTITATGFLNVGYSAEFAAIYVDMGSTVNAIASVLSIDVNIGGVWTAATDLVDGTAASGASFAQDGLISFTPPASWAAQTVDSESAFWIRLKWSATLTASIVVNDIELVPSPATWTIQPGISAKANPDAYTLEYGDDVQAFQMEYCQATEIKLSGAIDSPIALEVTGFGRQVTNNAFTGSLADAEVESALFQRSQYFLDDTAADLGTTRLQGAVRSVEANIMTGLVMRKYGDGNLYFTRVIETQHEVTVTLDLVNTAEVDAERTNWRNRTQRFLRIRIMGDDDRMVDFDIAGFWETFGELGDDDGETMFSATFKSAEDATWGSDYQLVVHNNISVMP